MRRRVLMISYYFPPLGGIGSLRALKFARYLPEFGWDPVVVAPRRGSYYRDPTLAFDERKVVRTGSLEISRTAKRMIGAGSEANRPARLGPVLGRLRHLVRRWVYRPDAQIGWYPFALAAGRRVLAEQRCDAILSSSCPVTAHLVAERLQCEYRIPWVAEFRDLWTDLGRYDSPRRQRLDEATERRLLTGATGVVTVSQGYGRVLSERGARRVAIVTNGFDPEDLAEGAPGSPPVVTYVGTYYADRQDLRTALSVLGELARSGPLAGLTVRFVGELPESLRPTLADAGLAGSTHCTGFVPHREVLRHLADSRLLLLGGPVSRAFASSVIQGNIASKVFEYLGSGRPILYVGDAGSDIEAVIRAFPGVACVRSGDVVGTREAILSLARRATGYDRAALAVYTHRSLTQRLAEAFDAACEDGAAPETSRRDVGENVAGR